MLRDIIATLYTGTMTVSEVGTTVDEDTGKDVQALTPVYEDEPCRISYNTVAVDSQENYGTKVQTVTLYCDPDLTIKPGSQIEVTQNGVTVTYKCSGVPAVYYGHQEVPITLWGEFA